MEEAPLNEDEVSTEYPAVAEDEEKEEEEEEEAAVVTPVAKKRGRPTGSRNKTPDVYTALLDRMTQLEENINRRHSESSTGGTLETPPPVTRPKKQAMPRAVVMAPPSPPISHVDLLMEQLQKSREERRLPQLDFYNTFLPR
jgi:hypothetical protein